MLALYSYQNQQLFFLITSLIDILVGTVEHITIDDNIIMCSGIAYLFAIVSRLWNVIVSNWLTRYKQNYIDNLRGVGLRRRNSHINKYAWYMDVLALRATPICFT